MEFIMKEKRIFIWFLISHNFFIILGFIVLKFGKNQFFFKKGFWPPPKLKRPPMYSTIVNSIHSTSVIDIPFSGLTKSHKRGSLNFILEEIKK